MFMKIVQILIKVQPVNSEVLVDMKNIESRNNCTNLPSSNKFIAFWHACPSMYCLKWSKVQRQTLRGFRPAGMVKFYTWRSGNCHQSSIVISSCLHLVSSLVTTLKLEIIMKTYELSKLSIIHTCMYSKMLNKSSLLKEKFIL